MSLLRDIQASAIDSSSDITVVLRKCKVLAARLANDSFKNWVENELNGYPDRESLPKYRILKVESTGNFSGPFGSSLQNVTIPIICLPEKVRENFSHSYLTQPISSLCDLISDNDNKGNPIEEWPSGAMVYFGDKIYQNMHCIGAWKVLPRNSIAAVIDTVRNRILSFVLEIETEAPDAGEAPTNAPPIAQEKVNQVFNTFVTGNIQNLSSGGTNYSQIGSIEVKKNDFQSLSEYLSRQNIPSEELIVLETALEEDKKSDPGQKSIGPKVSEWMGKMLTKAGNGIWKIGVDVASAVLTKAVTSYYGLS